MTIPVLTTERLLLRQFTMDDASAMEGLLGDEDVMRYSVIGRLSEERFSNHVRQWIDHYETHGFGIWAVMFEGDMIGFCGVDWKTVDEKEQIQISYRFNKAYWGKGLAYEAASAVCHYAMDTLKIPAIIALIDPENDRSLALAKKLGMKFSHDTMYLGHVRSIYRLEGEGSLRCLGISN